VLVYILEESGDSLLSEYYLQHLFRGSTSIVISILLYQSSHQLADCILTEIDYMKLRYPADQNIVGSEHSICFLHLLFVILLQETNTKATKGY
jgi:hypothetical protein